jgi:hypothetical protein
MEIAEQRPRHGLAHAAQQRQAGGPLAKEMPEYWLLPVPASRMDAATRVTRVTTGPAWPRVETAMAWSTLESAVGREGRRTSCCCPFAASRAVDVRGDQRREKRASACPVARERLQRAAVLFDAPS